MQTLIQPLECQPHLIIYGAGHVGKATAHIASSVGFKVTVVDDRDDWLTEERFSAETKLIGSDPVSVLDGIPDSINTYHLVVTHSHQLDQDLVQRLLVREHGWVGMIGSKTKLAKFLIRFKAAGMDPLLFERLHTPVGIDIGAQTPEEIAVSVVAELIQRRRIGDAAR